MNQFEFNYHLKKINTKNDSLETIYNFYYGRIIMFIRRKYEGGINIEQDVAQEFFNYLLNLNNLPYVKNPTAWVYTCCDHIALRLLKVERRYCDINENYIACD